MGIFNKLENVFNGGGGGAHEAENEAADPKEKIRSFVAWKKENDARSGVEPTIQDKRLEESKRNDLMEELGMGEEEFDALMQEVEAEGGEEPKAA